jgi:hypothetical protein
MVFRHPVLHLRIREEEPRGNPSPPDGVDATPAPGQGPPFLVWDLARSLGRQRCVIEAKGQRKAARWMQRSTACPTGHFLLPFPFPHVTFVEVRRRARVRDAKTLAISTFNSIELARDGRNKKSTAISRDRSMSHRSRCSR